MDLLSEAPSCDPEIQPELLKIREYVSPAYATLAVPVDCEPRLAADVATTSSYRRHSQDHQQAIQWFGIDVGGTLVKAVYYETQNDKTDPLTEGEGVAAMKKFIKSNLKYGSTGIRDQRLEMHGQKIGGYTGTLHFIKFATNRMCGFFDMATNNGLARFPKVVCATGGGAFKFESAFQERLGVKLAKYDEMQSLITGLHYLCREYLDECYYWENPNSDQSHTVPFQLGPDPYPYIIVNIGSGVSILRVNSANDFTRIGGTSVGGGTFTGLCSLLAGVDSFEAAITLAEKGDSHRVDKLVRDIYGGDYSRFGLGGEVVASSILRVNSATDFTRIGGTSVGGGTFTGLCSLLAGVDSFEAAITLAEKGDSHRVDKLVRDIYGGDYSRFGLGGEVVASSFGHMANVDRRKSARPEDLAKATLVTVTNNIGAIARMCASISGVERVVFVGNYLCGNEMSMQMLAYAMEYWSQGQIKALFLRHEGYFGALGCLLSRLNSSSQGPD
ncbi:Pantothenate kinase 3 [Geodia barretti]|uniref:pantothenate kinase n=1 Tax=Geodia barretti TaxID=519541 RepID=A0AA35SQ14_GEOBA|nr:Pantothenate kinase 3 [Geodia barretti]